MHPQQTRHTLTFSIWLGYLFFVVYGSLVPLEFKPLPFDQAWAFFQHVPMYKLGVESRADWISNGVLYVPVGFLTAHLSIQIFSETRRVPLYILAGVFSIALAFCVEFAQIFFPPRTVSLNDLLAESLGSLLGLMLAARYSEWFRALLHAMLSNPRRLTLRLLEAYLAGYVAFSLFPYDILLSAVELAQKVRGDNWGWFIAGDLQEKNLIVLKLLSEIMLTLPFGLFIGYRSVRQPARFGHAIILGALLGGCIEIGQFFTASGVSQGLSVLTRIAGVCVGLALWHRRANWSPERLAALAQRCAFPLGVTYLLVLLQINGWFSHPWNGPALAVSQLGDLHFLPFYYHYYTTEAKALFSLASVCLMYLPVGLLIWSNRGSPAQASFCALILAGLIETGKLFLQGMHPDPTNIMLGALAGWGVVHLARELSKAASGPDTAEPVPSRIPQSRHPEQTSSRRDKHTPIAGQLTMRWACYVALLPTLAFVAYRAATFPTQPVLLLLFLLACAAVIWQRPALFVAIVLAALPVLDLAPWSGRFYLDEFDLLILTSLAVAYVRIGPVPLRKRHVDTLFTLASALMALGLFIGAMRGLTPWQVPDANAFTNYYSPFNALRIAKGGLWAFLSYGLLRRLDAAGIDIKRPMAWGMAAGLTLTVAVILWERMTFGSLFDFASDHRVTGPFSAMHTGGAYIECYLAIATPFLILLVFQAGNWAVRALGAFLLLASTYALMVTFSRNGYSAYAVALAIVLFFAAFRSGRWHGRSVIVAGLCAAMIAVAIPVFTGQFAQNRIATIGKDFGDRQKHWTDALSIRTPGLLTTLFGMGLGRFPESHYLFSGEGSHSATYQLKKENGETFLRLSPGDPIYVEQIVPIEPRKNYFLRLSVRSNMPDKQITISLCEKWMLTSFNCIWVPMSTGNEHGIWKNVDAFFASGTLGENPWYSIKPVKLGLLNPSDKSIVDIKNIRLETLQGENLLRNGNFSSDLDHWFFSAENHLQWHTKSLPLAVFFDLGVFGLIATGFLSALAMRRAGVRAWRGDLHAAAALASMCGFLVVGLFDTLIDAPRFIFLLLILAWFAGERKTAAMTR
jgi:VanZ family protein